MNFLAWLILFLVAALAVVWVSLVIEALRKRPAAPITLYWAADIPIHYLDVAGTRVRYIETGEGPALVLLHTLRTQLDIFEKIIPELRRDFTVYALDYPGHGFSDFPDTDYVPSLFVKAVETFMDTLDIEDATLAGISIGGVIPLLVAANGNPRVQRVISINPYDYAGGRGVERGNLVAWLVFSLARIPVLGETVMRLRNPWVERLIVQGGVSDPASLTPGFLRQLWDSGVRPGHYRGLINLVRNAGRWEEAHGAYGRIRLPVLVIYGDRDWSRDTERERTVSEIDGAQMEIVRDGGHFLSMDQPGEVVRLIRQFAAS